MLKEKQNKLQNYYEKNYDFVRLVELITRFLNINISCELII